TCLIAREISLRRASLWSSGPMHTVATSGCWPTTCSLAWTNSSANRPWVTRIMPIISGGSSRRRARTGHVATLPVGRCNGSRLVRPFYDFGSARPQVAMENSGRKPALTQGFGNPLSDEHRAVSPAGAAESDVDVGLSLRRIARQQLKQQVANPGKGRRECRVALDMGADPGVGPGQLPKVGVPVGIVEEAHVEHQVRDR